MRACDISADELLRALLRLAPTRGVQILDSGGARGDGAEARYLIAGFDPFETIEARGDELLIRQRGASTARTVRDSLLSILDERLARYRIASQDAALIAGHDASSPLTMAASPSPVPVSTSTAMPSPTLATLPVAGACIASFSYDLARRFERLRSRAPASLNVVEPDAFLAFYDTLIIHDYAAHTTHLISVNGEAGLTRAASAIDDARRLSCSDVETLSSSVGSTQAASNFTRAEYLAAVERIREHIYAGDIYQANLTQRLTCPLAAGDSAEQVFLRLRRAHPASFGAFLRRPADTVISASPERFLRVSSAPDATDTGNNLRRVEAWPIKGTQRRGADAAQDARLRAELERSAKDAAENVMIVDLMRNDLGRVCRYGSVEVSALCEVQEHPTLFHLVSKVRGLLRAEVSAGALLRATFPCGSITGAPKLRAMEIIDEAERARRGLSMGAIGYFSFDGAIDLSVAIRTLTVRDRVASFNVGGGIVTESVAESEYAESWLKARALLAALGASR